MQSFEKEMMAKQQAQAGQQQDRMLKDGRRGHRSRPRRHLKAGQDVPRRANKGKPDVKTTPQRGPVQGHQGRDRQEPQVDRQRWWPTTSGTLIDGTKFDSLRRPRRTRPSSRSIGVIPGWTEILQKMKVGAKYQVFIPTELAYGANPSPGVIKPNDALIFEIELLEVK